ncbi:LysM domain-containing protein [Allopseudospirillum japonicum]|uniref:LysM domain-containing protein n=1 Tax=Allopseudospirillum japonicum TaxID=64971 RepID=A0A1H6R7B2_9GAMM|nr:LysM peptidoglycan-binding domain-containing protein [Allopseudospirillum japonicum]SEI47525.1 LysM domain-containing protein [Allopseudospirillum japonicum]
MLLLKNQPLLAGMLALSLSACATSPDSVNKIPEMPVVTKVPTGTPEEQLTQALQETAPEIYQVRRGDTLWDIAARYLKDPWLWPQLWQANPQLANPHLIYPGDILHLIRVEGVPQVVRASQNGAAQASASRAGQKEVVRLSPEIREIPLEEAIPTIPLRVIGGFLSQSRVIDASRLKQAAYVVGVEENKVVAGAGDAIFVRGDLDVQQKNYGIYRHEIVYRDLKTQEILGHEASYLGRAQLETYAQPLSTLRLNRSRLEVRASDVVLPGDEQDVLSSFTPKAPTQEVTGQIIHVLDGVSQIGRHSVVVIDKGKSSQLETGDTLLILQNIGKAKDPKTGELLALPPSRAGVLMVFRVFEQVSYAIVMQATRPLDVGDYIASP